MKIGGKMWQSAQAQGRPSFAKQMNRNAVRNHQATIQHYGQKLFDKNIIHGQESVRMSIQHLGIRMQEAALARFASNADLAKGLSEIKSASEEGVFGSTGAGLDKLV